MSAEEGNHAEVAPLPVEAVFDKIGMSASLNAPIRMPIERVLDHAVASRLVGIGDRAIT